jgi:cytochrome c-type biogenesis protein CcmH
VTTVAASPSPAATALQEDDDPREWEATYDRMIGELMSPYCHGLTLADCPTQGAAELRAQIRSWLVEGRREEWILDELEMQYGPSILGAPRMRGIGLLAWLVPPLFLLLGTIVVVLFLRRQAPACGIDANHT